MPSDSKKPRAAYMEDCDEDDKAVRGTRRSASTKGKGRSSKDRNANGDSGYSSQALTTESDNSLSPRSTRVEVVRDRAASDKASRRSSMSGASTRSPQKSSRPPLTRGRATAPPPLRQLEIPLRPHTRTDPTYYGVSPVISTPNSSVRSRPVSHYGGMPSVVSAPIPMSRPPSRPPMAPSAYFPPSVAMSGASYPMASPAESYMRYVPMRPDPYAVPDPLRNRDHLAARFRRGDPISRTASAQGYRPVEGLMNQPSFEQDVDRQSIRRRAKEAEDLRMMPPPPNRRTSVIDARDLRDLRELQPYPADSYVDGAGYDGRSSYRDPSPAPRSARAGTSRGSTYGYGGQERAAYQVEAPSQRRRMSYYEESPSSTLEEKLRHATGYQEEVTGGPPVSLTVEALQKQQRRAPSSGTYSSGSRDESDFRRSSTTRTSTSRVAGDGEDYVIKFKGSATVNIAGAEIKCDDGAELNIVRSKSTNNGSERSASEYGALATDDRRSRSDRRPAYARSASKSGYSSPMPANPRSRHGFF